MNRPIALDGPKSPERSKLLRAWADYIYFRPPSTWTEQDKVDVRERCVEVLNGIECLPQLCPGSNPDIEEQLHQVRAVQERRKREQAEAKQRADIAQRVTNRTRLLSTGELPSTGSCGCDDCIRRLLALEPPLHGAHSEERA